jgi:hypothetical protein
MNEAGVYPIDDERAFMSQTISRVIQFTAVCLVAAALASGCKESRQQRVDASRPVFQMRLALDTPSADTEPITLATKN